MVYLIAKEPYRMARIIAFLDPWQDSQGIGFQLTQSQIALGSGGIFGVGLGHSQAETFLFAGGAYGFYPFDHR